VRQVFGSAWTKRIVWGGDTPQMEQVCARPSATEAHNPKEHLDSRRRKVFPVDLLVRHYAPRGAQRTIQVPNTLIARGAKSDISAVGSAGELKGTKAGAQESQLGLHLRSDARSQRNMDGAIADGICQRQRRRKTVGEGGWEGISKRAKWRPRVKPERG
jgi:hypothetical protein